MKTTIVFGIIVIFTVFGTGSSQDEVTCGFNEIWTDCKDPCRATCDNYDEQRPICKARCRPGCDCMPGYVRDGPSCVLPSECPIDTLPCPTNKTYTSPPFVGKTCDNLQIEIKRPGCYSKPGYVLDRNTGHSILPKDCPKEDEVTCGFNEIWTDCKDPCRATCDNYDEQRPICKARCRPGCDCMPGYVRDGPSCVLPSECPIDTFPCPTNKTYTSPPRVTKTCDNLQIQIKRPGCYCKPGYVLDRNTGHSVLPKDCPKDQSRCGPYQVYAPCRDNCRVSCDNYKTPPTACTLQCIPGCDCLSGYVLFGDRCVQPQQCPRLIRECPRNKTFVSVDMHIRTCDNVNIYPRTPGCYCKRGYLYDRYTGNCVMPKDCPRLQYCPRHEELGCVTPCPTTCMNLYPDPCPTLRCERGCVCQEDYVRNEMTGTCIKAEQCPAHPCYGPNEEYKRFGPKCQPTCSNRNPLCGVFGPGCFCKAGYIREHTGGQCIPVMDCFIRSE